MENFEARIKFETGTDANGKPTEITAHVKHKEIRIRQKLDTIPLNIIPELLCRALNELDELTKTKLPLHLVTHMQALHRAVMRQKLRVRAPSSAPIELEDLPRDYASLTRMNLVVSSEEFISYARDNYAVKIHIGLQQSLTARDVWTEERLRELLKESNQPGATQQKLADRYGSSRQFISKMLKKAKELPRDRNASLLGWGPKSHSK